MGNVGAHRTTAVTLTFVLAGALGGASAGGGDGVHGRTLKRHASVPAITTGHLPASDPSAIARRWGVEITSLRLASRGYMLELRYRVLDASKAQPLFDRAHRPILRDDVSGLETGVPNPPTTGSLRSSNDAKAGRTYFMFFANTARFVGVGNTVTVTIGEFQVSGIPVRGESEPLTAEAAPPPTGHEAHLAQIAAAARGPAVRTLEPEPPLDDIALVDQNGRATTLRQAVGSDKPVLLNFIFTTCTTICPVMSAGMSQFLANLGTSRDEVRVVSISIDPEHDSVGALREYAARYHATPSWRFLTGRPEAIEAAQRAFGSFRGGKYNHAPGTFVRSSPGGPWIALDGFASADTLRRAFQGQLVAPPS